MSTIIGTALRDVLTPTAEHYGVVAGLGGNDLVLAGSASSIILGGAGNDVLFGGAGDDVISGGAGLDIIDGGAGRDTLSYSIDPDEVDVGVRVNLAAGWTMNLAGNAYLDHFQSIEDVVGTNAPDIVGGSAGENYISGRGGSDVLRGRGGNDVLSGGNGNDAVHGGAGNDILSGGWGLDHLYGGAGRDTVNYLLDPNDAAGHGAWGFNINLGQGRTHTLHDPKVVDWLDSIENAIGSDRRDFIHGTDGANYLAGAGGVDVVRGYGGADILSGGDGADTLDGGAGNDIFAGGAGLDHLYGGAGLDTVSYVIDKADRLAGSDGWGFNIDLALGRTNSRTTGELEDRLYSIESAVGSAGADILFGSSGANYLAGASGNDHLYGRGGDDILSGGAGGDHLYGGAGNDILSGGGVRLDHLDGGPGIDTVSYVIDPGFANGDANGNGLRIDLATGLTSVRNTNFYADTLKDIENAIGSNADDIVRGSAGANYLSGAQGADVIIGRDGDDTVRGDGGDDVVYGELGADVLFGGDGDDTLFGGAGNDILSGGAGYDVLRGEGGFDTVSYQIDGQDAQGGPSGSGFEINLMTGDVWSLDTRELLDRLETIEAAVGSNAADIILGSDGANILVGNVGNDFLSGAGGDDLLVGGAGDDILVGGDGDDTLLGTQGSDVLDGNAGADAYLLSHVSRGVHFFPDGADTLRFTDIASADIDIQVVFVPSDDPDQQEFPLGITFNDAASGEALGYLTLEQLNIAYSLSTPPSSAELGDAVAQALAGISFADGVEYAGDALAQFVSGRAAISDSYDRTVVAPVTSGDEADYFLISGGAAQVTSNGGNDIFDVLRGTHRDRRGCRRRHLLFERRLHAYIWGGRRRSIPHLRRLEHSRPRNGQRYCHHRCERKWRRRACRASRSGRHQHRAVRRRWRWRYRHDRRPRHRGHRRNA